MRPTIAASVMSIPMLAGSRNRTMTAFIAPRRPSRGRDAEEPDLRSVGGLAQAAGERLVPSDADEEASYGARWTCQT